MSFAEPDRLLWLIAIPALALLLALSIARSQTLLKRFIDATMLERLAPTLSPWRAALRILLILLAAATIITALARPQWGTEARTVARMGRDVVFLIDISRSMLAEDLAPNRLERAKIWIADALDARADDRVAIVGFAGGTTIAAPLTFDHAFARLALEELDTESVSLGGTNIGDAIRRTVADVFELTTDSTPNPRQQEAQREAPKKTPKEARQRDIILITDGEDHDSLPIDAAAAAGQLGIRIITIGIGSAQGVNIPVTTRDGRRQPLRHEGEPVVSRLRMPTLQAIAAATPGGQAIEVETGDIDLADVYDSLVRAATTANATHAATNQSAERFQWFLFPAIALLLLERLIPATRRARKATAR